MIIDNTPDDKTQAIFLNAHLRLLNVGLKNSKMSATKILSLASKITNKNYKRGQYTQAINDLNNVIRG